MLSSAYGMHPKRGCVMLNWVKTSLVAPLPLPGPARKAVTGEEHHDLTSLPHGDIYARLDAFRHRM